MDALWKAIGESPTLSTALAVFCLTDAVNCIRLGHLDWWVPCIVAIYIIQNMRAPRDA